MNCDWIPLKIRHLNTEEIDHLIAQAYSENPFAFIYDCELPEDEEEVFVTLHDGTVSTDSFVRDPFIGNMGYFGKYCDEGEVVAWMHKPEPYKPEKEIK